MSEITAASTEQSAGIEQVNLAITQMDEVTQQNAALVEEAAAAAESLEEQAQNLSVAVRLSSGREWRHGACGASCTGSSSGPQGCTREGSGQGVSKAKAKAGTAKRSGKSLIHSTIVSA